MAQPRDEFGRYASYNDDQKKLPDLNNGNDQIIGILESHSDFLAKQDTHLRQSIVENKAGFNYMASILEDVKLVLEEQLLQISESNLIQMRFMVPQYHEQRKMNAALLDRDQNAGQDADDIESLLKAIIKETRDTREFLAAVVNKEAFAADGLAEKPTLKDPSKDIKGKKLDIGGIMGKMPEVSFAGLIVPIVAMLYGLDDVVRGIKNMVVPLITKVLPALSSIFQPLANLVKAIPLVGRTIPGLNLVFGVIDFFVGFVKEFADSGSISKALEMGVRQIFHGFITAPLDWLRGALAWTLDEFGADKMAGWMRSFSFEETFADMRAKIVDRAGILLKSFADDFANVWDWAVDSYSNSDLVDRLKQRYDLIQLGIQSIERDVLSSIDTFAGWLDSVNSWAGSIGASFGKWMDKVTSMELPSFENPFDAISERVQQWQPGFGAGWIKDILSEIFPPSGGIGNPTTGNITKPEPVVEDAQGNIIGGAGSDTLVGGSGADRIVPTGLTARGIMVDRGSSEVNALQRNNNVIVSAPTVAPVISTTTIANRSQVIMPPSPRPAEQSFNSVNALLYR